MKPCKEDGLIQLTAAIRLLNASGLLVWRPELSKFGCTAESCFECKNRKLDEEVGRLICWMTFSAGAEFLAKGVCLVYEIDSFRSNKHEAFATPEKVTENWMKEVADGNLQRETTVSYGTLNDLLNEKKGTQGALGALFQRVKASESAKIEIRAAYKFLQKSIRNRDAHAYIPHVRPYNFRLIEPLFVPALNQLLGWVPQQYLPGAL